MARARFVTSNNRFLVATIDGVRKFVVMPIEGPVKPTNLVVHSNYVSWDGVSDIINGYHFYLDDVTDLDDNSTFLGQMIVKPIPMDEMFPGTALYPNN